MTLADSDACQIRYAIDRSKHVYFDAGTVSINAQTIMISDVFLMFCVQGAEQAHKLSFVDLAGSERAGRTGNTGHRLKCAPAKGDRSPLSIILFWYVHPY